MLVRSQDNEKITDRIEFLIAEIPLKGEYGIYQPDQFRLFAKYSTMKMAIKALDMLAERCLRRRIQDCEGRKMLMTIWTHLMATMVGACIGMFLMCCLIAGKEDEDE